MLGRATGPLTTPQSIALARPSRNAAFRHLTELAREGLVRRIGGGGANRRSRRTDLRGARASEASTGEGAGVVPALGAIAR